MTLLNFLPSLMFGMISSESCASSDIAKSLKDEQKWAQYDSIVKRINRFFNNDHFDGKVFFNNVITSILVSYKSKHSNNSTHKNYIIDSKRIKKESCLYSIQVLLYLKSLLILTIMFAYH